MVSLLSIERSTTDATGIIAPRLEIGTMTAVFVDTGGMLTVPIFELPSWMSIGGQIAAEPEPDELVPMSPSETRLLMSLDESHNPMLAELWRDDMNDDLVDNS